MGALWGKIKAKADPDQLLSYSTVKFVVIRDKRLGILHHSLQFAIFVYIVVYTIIYQQRYLLLEPPYGSIRATAREPDNWGDVNNLPYCAQNQPSYNNYTNYECVYMLGTDVVYPPGQENAILISTRIKDSILFTPPNCSKTFPTTTVECAPSSTKNVSSTRYFTADIDQFTIYMEHAIFGRENEIAVSNVDCDGKLYFRNGSKSEMIFNNRSRIGDIIPLSTLLNAADIKSLNEPSGLSSSFRYDGALVVVVITYTNYVMEPSKLRYNYKLYLIPKQDVVFMEPSVDRVQRNWYGIRFVFLVVGAIGYFDFPTLLTSLVNGTVLIKVATVVVDMLILYIMPNKKYYSEHKFEPANEQQKSKSPSSSHSKITAPLLKEDYGSITMRDPANNK